MERYKVEQANNIIKTLDELKSYKDLKHNGNHFQFRQHYGSESRFVIIPKEYNRKFIEILDEIIVEYEQKLEDL